MPENNNCSVYEVQNLVKEYNGRQILNVPALSFDRGRIYCLYGPNGSGKSTLFKVLTLLEKPTSGRILFNSKEIFPGDFGLNFMRSSVTLVQQNPLLFNTTVEKNVAYGLMVRNTGAKKKKQRVKECLEFVGLDGFQERKACEISGGEAQRVAIARAIAVDPDLIFLDEFSANIDSKNREVVENIVKLARKYGVYKARISCCEPTICKDHLLQVLEIIERISDIKLFILETNGILFGTDRDFVKEVLKFSKVYVRLSLKAGTPEGFTWRTGAIPQAYELPFKAIEYFVEEGVSLKRFHVAAMTDPRIMSEEERRLIIERLWKIDPKLAINLEEEVVDPYDTTLIRLKKAGIELRWPM